MKEGSPEGARQVDGREREAGSRSYGEAIQQERDPRVGGPHKDEQREIDGADAHRRHEARKDDAAHSV